MEKKTFTLVLANDARVENLELNGNNYISRVKITPDMFEGNLSKVTVIGPDGVQKHGQMELVQITEDAGAWWFVLRDLSEAEIAEAAIRAQLEDANNAVAELSELIAGVLG